jgi:hypothetical protein
MEDSPKHDNDSYQEAKVAQKCHHAGLFPICHDYLLRPRIIRDPAINTATIKVPRMNGA